MENTNVYQINFHSVLTVTVIIKGAKKQRFEVNVLTVSYLVLTSWAAVSTDCTEPTSRCNKSTLALVWEVSRAERAASARCMFLQARHSRSWLSSASSLSHKARPMPLQRDREIQTADKQSYTRVNKLSDHHADEVSHLVNTEDYLELTIQENRQ